MWRGHIAFPQARGAGLIVAVETPHDWAIAIDDAEDAARKGVDIFRQDRVPRDGGAADVAPRGDTRASTLAPERTDD
ncbi:hypothetical protein DYH55_12425 [Methylovirgula sp. 4M-Z18]|nr:hypothetical protein DYH55_12425 [Methylovirgula sp. 4M-Z18]